MSAPRLKGALGLLGFFAACSAEGGAVTPSLELDAGRGDATAELPSPSAYSTAMQTVDTLTLLSELSRSALEGALGVSLSVPTDGSEAGTLETGPFARVERRALAGEPAPQTLVILDVRAGVALPLSEFRATGRIGPSTPFDVNPELPAEGTLTFRERTPTQTTLYEFTAQSQRLRGVILVRPPDD